MTARRSAGREACGGRRLPSRRGIGPGFARDGPPSSEPADCGPGGSRHPGGCAGRGRDEGRGVEGSVAIRVDLDGLDVEHVHRLRLASLVLRVRREEERDKIGCVAGIGSSDASRAGMQHRLGVEFACSCYVAVLNDEGRATGAADAWRSFYDDGLPPGNIRGSKRTIHEQETGIQPNLCTAIRAFPFNDIQVVPEPHSKHSNNWGNKDEKENTIH